MSVDRAFVDTNVLVYLFDDAEPAKRKAAVERIEAERRTRELVISTQVLHELYVALTKGADPIASPAVAEQAVRDAAQLTTVQIDLPLALEAIAWTRRASLSFWDALIVSAAIGAKCGVLLSEDLNHGESLDGLRVENPFLASSSRGA